MAHQRWYWGVVIRVDTARNVLLRIAEQVDGDDVRAQDARTGHITVFYAPLRSRRDAPVLAERIRAEAATIPPFDITCSAFGEFASTTRPVAWLGVGDGAEQIIRIREQLCACDADKHRHTFIPHLTLAYGEDTAAYAAIREQLRESVTDARCTTTVTELWIAGFPQNGHPARDLRYAERVPLARQ